ncbi:hypothetical protein [Rickettsia asembonensis]|uniref:Polymerase nucleotidyl transferase domain-containing protein n=2 Tax=Rickettsia asembonensis TaxID=1068590 RepID=A0A0C2R8I2_9RICK|nr:hypothetical protein [Rickettsia asembonensis]KIJ88533.1 hypothetical protein SB78_05105 [Rickettsia asembonensis]
MILLDSFLEHVQKVNCSESFLYFVNYVGLFGSLVSNVEQVNDIDLIVELKPKFPYDLDKIQELHEEMEEKEGKNLKSSWIDRMFAPEDKVRKFLKNKNRYINIMAPSNVQCLSLKKESVITIFSL